MLGSETQWRVLALEGGDIFMEDYVADLHARDVCKQPIGLLLETHDCPIPLTWAHDGVFALCIIRAVTCVSIVDLF